MKKLGRIALVLTGAAALSVTSLVASAGPVAPPSHTIVDRNGDGLLEYGGVEPLTLPEGYSAAGLHTLLSFVQMTDLHVTDEESPGRLEFLAAIPGLGGAYRPNESLTTQTLEATVESVKNAVSPLTHDKPTFVMATGDSIDSQQLNELQWVRDILDGGTTINPNSGGAAYEGVQGNGVYYDPNGGQDGAAYASLRNFPGLFQKAQEPFHADGLGMPWYAVVGNHDPLVQGNVSLAYLGQGGVEDYAPPLGTATSPFAGSNEGHVEIAYPSYQRYVTGPKKVATIIGDPTASLTSLLMDPLAAANDTTKTVAIGVTPDPNRCYLAKTSDNTPAGYNVAYSATAPTHVAPSLCAGTSFVQQMQAGAHGWGAYDAVTGLGWPSQAQLNHDAYYSFSPQTGFRFVVLDTSTDECLVARAGMTGPFCDMGSLDSVQFDWLQSQLAAAHSAKEHVIVISHHPLENISNPYGDNTETRVTAADVQNLLCSYDEVLANVAGDTHDNRVSYATCAGGPGYVRVQTTSEMDWPQQTRLIQVVQNKRGQLALALSMINQAAPPRVSSDLTDAGVLQLASISREIAFARAGYGADGAAGSPSDRNVVVDLHRTAS